jgi:hydroxymethylpyrimidine pyrophosphatase-like HAD family hydrolase
MPKIKLLAFDLDGTALTIAKQVSTATRAAFEKASRAGVVLVPCTGRSLHYISASLDKLIKEMGTEAIPYLITDNGSQVYSLLHRKLLNTSFLPLDPCLELLALGRKNKAIIYAGFGIEGAFDIKGGAWEDESLRSWCEESRKFWTGIMRFGDLEQVLTWYAGAVHMIFDFPGPKERDPMLATLRDRKDIGVTFSSPRNIEFSSPGDCKGKALLWLANYAQIPMENIMAAGDNRNDLEMLEEAGFGVAMGNALSEVKAAANYVTAGNDDDGLALAIDKALEF